MDSRLNTLIEEATQALSHLDADRLSELALTCQALTREFESPAEAGARAGEARQAARGMDVFSGVLAATRTNLDFMQRLWVPGNSSLEYRPPEEGNWTSNWSGRGEH